MKIIIIAMILILNISHSFAQSVPSYKHNSGVSENDFKLSQNYPDPFDEFTIIQFSLTSDKYVKIYVKDNSDKIIETIVEGEVENGVHNIIYKPQPNQEKGVYFYCMEIFSEPYGNVLYSDKKEMQYDKRNIVLFKK